MSVFVCLWTGLNEQRAWCFPLMRFIQLSIKKKGQPRTESLGGPGCLVELHFLFSPTFFYLYSYITNWMLSYELQGSVAQSAHVCLLFLHYLLIEWLCRSSSGSGTTQLGPLSPNTRRGRMKPPVDRDWLMGSRPVELVRWALVHLLSQALMNASLIELLNPMLQPS